MVYFNLNTGLGFKLTKFPDGQPHICLNNLLPGQALNINCSITNPTVLFTLSQIVEAAKYIQLDLQDLFIPYLMGARSDRRGGAGHSFDLKIVADTINSFGFDRVGLFDPHSDVSTALINNSVVFEPKGLLKIIEAETKVFIFPDAGAEKRYKQLIDPNAVTVQCIKKRDPNTGHIVIRVLEPNKCKGKFCTIVDDICDGGATFIEIAKQIKPKSLALMVSHGVFSKGFIELEKYFDVIVTSNSLPQKAKPKLHFVVVDCPSIFKGDC